MHELSLATAMMQQLEDVLRAESASVILRIDLELGALSGVVKDAFAFAFPLAAEGGPAAGAELVFDEVPVTVRCADCGQDSHPPPPMIYCERCASTAVEVIAGRDFRIKSLEVR